MIVMLQLFTTLLCPILECGSVIWDPQYAVHSDRIESVQIQFLLFCLRRLALIKLPSLKSRRKMLNAVFLLKLINVVINSQFLLEKLYIRVPVRPTRYYNFINIIYYTTNYAIHSSIHRICNNFSNLYLHTDLNKNLESIKKAVISHLNLVNY